MGAILFYHNFLTNQRVGGGAAHLPLRGARRGQIREAVTEAWSWVQELAEQ
jgi:hypothetical protein